MIHLPDPLTPSELARWTKVIAQTGAKAD